MRGYVGRSDRTRVECDGVCSVAFTTVQYIA